MFFKLLERLALGKALPLSDRSLRAFETSTLGIA